MDRHDPSTSEKPESSLIKSKLFLSFRSVRTRDSPTWDSGLRLWRDRNASVLGHACDVVGGAIGQGLDSTGRLVSAAGDKTTAVHDEEVGHIVGAMEFVHH